MELRVSANLKKFIPDLKTMLDEIEKCAKSLDSGISTKHLYVEARCCQCIDEFCGTAHPEIYTLDRRWKRDLFNYHLDGKITMSIGVQVKFKNIATLFSHELRHIGQFHRGRKEYGFMCIDPMTARQSEHDAYEFEDKCGSLL